MDFKTLIKHVSGIIFKPREEWEVIKNESTTVGDMLPKYAIILPAVPAIAGFIGNAIVGRSVMGYTVRLPILDSLKWTIMQYVLSFVGIIIIGYFVCFVIDALATTFGSQKGLVDSMKVAIFSFTPIFVASILYIIPKLAYLGMIVGGLYYLYLLYLGIKIVKNPPLDKAMGYFIVVHVVLIVYFAVFSLIGFIVGLFTFFKAGGLI